MGEESVLSRRSSPVDLDRSLAPQEDQPGDQGRVRDLPTAPGAHDLETTNDHQHRKREPGPLTTDRDHVRDVPGHLKIGDQGPVTDGLDLRTDDREHPTEGLNLPSDGRNHQKNDPGLSLR